MFHPSSALFFAIGMPGTGELVVILAIILVLFGGAKIPDIAKNLGKGIREFKKAITGGGEDDKGGNPPEAKK